MKLTLIVARSEDDHILGKRFWEEEDRHQMLRKVTEDGIGISDRSLADVMYDIGMYWFDASEGEEKFESILKEARGLGRDIYVIGRPALVKMAYRKADRLCLAQTCISSDGYGDPVFQPDLFEDRFRYVSQEYRTSCMWLTYERLRDMTKIPGMMPDKWYEEFNSVSAKFSGGIGSIRIRSTPMGLKGGTIEWQLDGEGIVPSMSSCNKRVPVNAKDDEDAMRLAVRAAYDEMQDMRSSLQARIDLLDRALKTEV